MLLALLVAAVSLTACGTTLKRLGPTVAGPSALNVAPPVDSLAVERTRIILDADDFPLDDLPPLELIPVDYEPDQTRLRLRQTGIVASSNPIAAARMPGGDATLPNPTFAGAGAGTIPARVTACATVGDAGQILTYSQPTSLATTQAALDGCVSGQHVFMNTGTYTFNSKLVVPSNVTLRGAGPDLTRLNFTGDSNCDAVGDHHVCFRGPNIDGQGEQNRATWTGGFTQGTTTITLGPNTTGSNVPQVDGVMVLAALSDGVLATDDTWPEPFESSVEGETTQNGSDSAASGHEEWLKSQTVKITSVSGSAGTGYTIGITPPLSMPSEYWVGAGSPTADWVHTTFTKNAGVEDLWIHNSTSVLASSIFAAWSTNIWIKNVKVTNHGNNCGGGGVNWSLVKLQFSSHVTVRDSYFFGECEPQQHDSYGVSVRIGGNHLIENNIFQKIRAPILIEEGQSVVSGYNYATHMVSTDGWNTSGVGDNHANAGNHLLWEGNDNTMINMENYNGNGQFAFMLRNNLTGQDESSADNQTAAIFFYAYNRHGHVLGNVLGLTGFHTRYEHNANQSGGISCKNSIYTLGHGDNCTIGGGVTYPDDDPRVEESIFLWGNWDVVTSTDDNGTNDTTGLKWDSAEVPSGLSLYANAVPSTQTVPNSLYLSAKPSFFGSRTWPPIGPNVANGEVANRGGHVNKIPARACFEALGGAWADTTAVAFTGWKAGVCVF